MIFGFHLHYSLYYNGVRQKKHPFPRVLLATILLRKSKADNTDSGHLASEIRIPSSGFLASKEIQSDFFLLPKRIKRRCSGGGDYCSSSGGWTCKAGTMIRIGTLVHQLERIQRRVRFAYSCYWMCSIAVILHLTRYRNAVNNLDCALLFAFPCASLKHQSQETPSPHTMSSILKPAKRQVVEIEFVRSFHGPSTSLLRSFSKAG